MGKDVIESKKLERERMARVEAESILERKSLELYSANEALKTLANNLKEKEERTRAILETTADSIVVLDAQGRIELCNDTACQLFGETEATLIGQSINELIVQSTKKKQSTFDMLEQLDEKKLYELFAKHHTNKLIPIELAIAKRKISKTASLIVCAIRDISTRKIAEQRLAAHHGVTRVLSESNSLEEAAPQILKIICDTLNFDFGCLWVVNFKNETLQSIFSHNKIGVAAKRFEEETKTIALAYGVGFPGRVWQNKKPTWIKDVTVDMNFPRIARAREAGFQSAFGFPILFDDEVIGVIEFFTLTSSDFDDQFVKLLDDIGHQIGLFIERKRTQERIHDLNRELVMAARLAGMTEVATSVLHNVGNVLNSVNVSASLLAEHVLNSELKALTQVAELVKQHQDDLPSFIINNEQGKLLPRFLIMLGTKWEEEKTNLVNEIHSLMNNIQHIKNIISMQQSLGSSLGISEHISLPSLVEDALTITTSSFSKNKIAVQKSFDPKVPEIMADKVKILQILVNLLRNAIDAIATGGRADPCIMVAIKLKTPATIAIEVKDNGVGIEANNLTQIFSYGFTTKKDGHGFGLHASANSAQELGGKLFARSEGSNEGATFILELPVIQHKEKIT